MNIERRKHPIKSIVFLFFLLFFIWVLLQFLAPLALPSSSVTDLSGVVGITDNEDQLREMPLPWNAVYSIGDHLCHQKVERSLFINGNEMPFCARCTAIWIGLVIGLGFIVVYRLELHQNFIVAIILALVPIGIDGLGQLLGLWESINIIRILTGLPAGIICGIALGIIIDEVRCFPFFSAS